MPRFVLAGLSTLVLAVSLLLVACIGLQTVEEGGPADDAGLRQGDIIVKLAGDDIKNSGDLFKALTENRAGDRVEVEFFRGSSQKSAEITLG